VPKKPTIQDIAKHAGVSPTTVSRVLNNFDYISEEKRHRVMAAMEELDYRPSFSARYMRTQRSRLIGLLADQVTTTPYAGEIIAGAQEVAWEHDHFLLQLEIGNNVNYATQAIETLLEREVESIIYAAYFHHAVTLPKNITQVPVVLANCYVEDRSLPSVVPDEVLGGYQATEVILKKGHRRIGFINLNADVPVQAFEGRLKGYCEALADFDVDYDASLVCEGDGGSHKGYSLGQQLIKLSDPPTAIFCATDRTAMGVYDALKEQGLRIPDDIAIVGFDNQANVASELHPSLSTMQLPHYEMGRWAVEYLLNDHTDNSLQKRPVQHQLPCPYIARASV
jgi:LacI family transcriptional regulator